MGILNRLTRSNKSKKITVNSQVSGVASSYYNTNYVYAKGSTYDNTYPSVKAISNAFLTIRPYAIDANGDRLRDNRLVNALARPNNKMSGADFREAIAVSVLTHRKTYILVAHQEGRHSVWGGKITPNNLSGFAIIEDAEIRIEKNGTKTYKIGDSLYGESEVMEISGGYDPDNLDAGYSPSIAIKKWANVDDYIVDYQAGFFENGAVPAGQFVITAGSVDQFNAIVDEMQRKHRSSGQNNNVMYIHKPISAEGMVQPAQVEWIPFSQPNNQLGLKEIFDETNKKIDSAFGVPASIRGVNDNNTYASVKVDEQLFIKYTVKPFATKVWTKFVSELNRITGGLGYALTFDIEMPNVADEEKVIADKKAVELGLITNALNAGFELDSIIDAFELSEGYKKLIRGNNGKEEDVEEVADNGESDIAPDVNETLPKAFSHTCTDKNCTECGVHKAIDAKGEKLENKLEDILTEFTENKVNNFIKANLTASKAVEDEVTEEDLENYLEYIDYEEENDQEERSKVAQALIIAILAYMVVRGAKQFTDGLKLVQDKLDTDENFNVPSLYLTEDGLKLDIAKIAPYAVTLVTQTAYQNRLSEIMLSYDRQVSQTIREALQRVAQEAIDAGRPIRRDVIIEEVKKVTDLDEWRIKRIAVTEENHARQLAQLDAMKDLASKIGIKVKKKWLALGTHPCEFCREMNGTVTELETAFVPYMGVVNGKDGGLLVNKYDDMQSAQAHPNCQCKLDFILEGE